MNYTVNEVNILFTCGIRTIPTLLKHLCIGGFKIAQSTLEKKVAILRSGELVYDKRTLNTSPSYFSQPANLRSLKPELLHIQSLLLKI